MTEARRATRLVTTHEIGDDICHVNGDDICRGGRDDVVMYEKIYRLCNVFYLTISPVRFFLEKNTIPGVVT